MNAVDDRTIEQSSRLALQYAVAPASGYEGAGILFDTLIVSDPKRALANVPDDVLRGFANPNNGLAMKWFDVALRTDKDRIMKVVWPDVSRQIAANPGSEQSLKLFDAMHDRGLFDDRGLKELANANDALKAQKGDPVERYEACASLIASESKFIHTKRPGVVGLALASDPE
jgi:hypothetical protein